MTGPASRRPRADGGLPLAPARRDRPPQHQRGPGPPPGGLRRPAGRGAGRHRLAPLSRPVVPAAAGRDRRPPRGRPGSGVRGQRLERGAADALPHLRRARVGPRPCSSPPTRCTATSPASPAPGWRWASAPPTSPSTSTRSAACSPTWRPGHHVPVLAQQPDRHGRARGRRARRSSTRPPASSWSTRPTASSRRGRRSSWSTASGRSSSPAPSRRRGRWPRPGSATWSGRRGS